ncbi:MAG: histidinol-phosphatase [Clostridia bacterium]|nr:histidinol-phosphatase [Clostridia bacterium]
MRYSDMHTHGDYSDGRGSFKKFMESAREKGIVSLGFSDHSPVPIDNGWSMKKESLPGYLSDLESVKQKSSGGPEIYAGLELDYIPGINVKEYIGFDGLPLDYFLGSVHYVYSDKQGEYFTVDGSFESFDYLVKKGFEGNGKAVFKAYYNNVREMIASYVPAVIAHIDLVTKNNRRGIYFDTGSDEYKNEIEKTLDIVKLYGSIVEINTGGMSRGYMDKPYPSEYILYKCLEKGIPVAMNSDAHSPDALAYGFENVLTLIKAIGFNEIITYQNGTWTPRQL